MTKYTCDNGKVECQQTGGLAEVFADVAVLVTATYEGLKEQSPEAAEIFKGAFIVAILKGDLFNKGDTMRIAPTGVFKEMIEKALKKRRE